MFVNSRNLSRLLLFIAGGLFLLLPPQSAGAVPPQTSSASDLQLCDDAQADPDLRIPACTRLIASPGGGINLAEIYNHRGAAKVRKGYLDDAIADFTSALNENPKFVDAFKNRGLVRKMQDNYVGEIDDFNQAIRLNGKSPDLYNLRGSALLDKQAYNPAIADFGKAIALDSKYTKAYVNRGQALVFTRQLNRAIADFDMVVRLAPNDPLGYVNRAMARMDKGDFKGAIADYNVAIRLDPDNSVPYTRRGEAWRLQGNFQQSLEDHNKAIALNPNDKEAYNNRALTYIDQGKLDEALADCDQAILLNPAYDFAYATRGLIRRLKKDLWGSLADLNKAVELKPSSPVALTFRGDTLRESENTSGAMGDFNKAILILPDFVAAYTGRGLTYEKMDNLAKAKADFEKALKLPADVDAGLARPAQALAREHLAALAAAEAARAKAVAESAPNEPTGTLPKPEPAKLVPEDIAEALHHRGHALLIGVSNYTSGWDQLASVKNDLHDLKEGLAPHFETVDTVQNPTVAEIRSKMRDFLLGHWNKPDERLFIYYSGHGFTDFNQSSRQYDGYITGNDTPIYNQTDGRAVENAVQFGEIDSWNRQTKARQVLMVFDSCFSGSLFQTKGAKTVPSQYDLDNVRTLLRKPIRYVITAGRQNEQVAADSTFARLLLRGLSGAADFSQQGVVSADALGIYLFNEVPRATLGRQMPQYNSIGNTYLTEGQFFFLAGPAAAGASAPLPQVPADMTPGGPASNGPGSLSNKKSGIK